MLTIWRNVNYGGGPGNSVLATVVTVYWPLTISNTFSKRPHKPCNTSKHVENGTTLEHFDQLSTVSKCIIKNKREGVQIFFNLKKVHQQYFSPL